ncbi:unnamed protein product [Parnassius apollo]|uniref:(apollo) hypothetical protein n=1 Tax=Parnassius apollo TaxID=110799 RepID=A0A8S3X4G9_PARAO|nr:unnamed protein product [Parnassius apollo]
MNSFFAELEPSLTATEQNLTDRVRYILCSNILGDAELVRLRREAVPPSDENPTAGNAAPLIADQPVHVDAALYIPVVVDPGDDGDQKRLYKSLDRAKVCGTGPVPDQVDTVAFWRGLWSVPVNYSEGPWMEVMASQGASVMPMDSVNKTPEDVVGAVHRAPNWISLGLDGLHQYWLKGFVLYHAVLARQFQEVLDQK